MGAQSQRAVWGGYLRTGLRALVPPASRNRIDRRILQLLAGLILYGISDSFLVLGRLGLDPWDVFQQGLARHSAISIGNWSILVGIAVLFLWIPLRQRPGIGTLLNAIVVGVIMDVILGAVAPPRALRRLVRSLFPGLDAPKGNPLGAPSSDEKSRSRAGSSSAERRPHFGAL